VKTAQFKKSLSVSLKPEVFEHIKKITDQKQISIADWVRSAVDKALENEPLPDDLRF
jgi:hypothetical protein